MAKFGLAYSILWCCIWNQIIGCLGWLNQELEAPTSSEVTRACEGSCLWYKHEVLNLAL